MRCLAFLVVVLLPGCTATTGLLVGAEAASVVVFGRGVVDIGVSAVSGRDCSIVRLDRGLTYCAPEAAGRPVPLCTRSLGVVDCWADPALLPRPMPGVADTPPATPAQVRYRTARWPKALNGL